VKPSDGVHIIRNFPIEINRRAALRHLGYKSGSKIDDRIKTIIDQSLERAKQLAEPAGIYLIDIIVEHSADEVKLGCGIVIRSKPVSRLMRFCTKAVIFTVTVGPAAEAEAAQIMDDKPAEAVILDSAAGEAAEGAVEYLHKTIQMHSHRANLHLTPRFSPGYADWPLEAQRDIFACLRPERIGITLTETCMMIPRKSVSGIIGLGPLPGIRTGASPCKQCAKTLKS
jgi:hypothetical protein